MNYQIGQVLFVVLAKKNQVYPMQVIETITKRTLSGEEINYILQAGQDKSSKVSLDQVDGEIFETADKARRTLIQRATSQITKLVEVAVNKAGEWYGVTEQSPQTINDLPDLMAKPPAPQIEEDASLVTMPDGSVVKVKLPAIIRESV
jgi:hypothetical protein